MSRLRDTIGADLNRFRALSGQGEVRGIWRAFVNPRVLPVALFRLASWCRDRRWLGWAAALLTLVNLILFRVEIPARAKIGKGLVLPHPGGIVIGSAEIGENVSIYQNVTLGAKLFDGAYDLSTRPVVGDGVTIAAGAVVVGGITVGAGAVVAANSLVIEDVAPGSTVIGVPAAARRKR